MAKTNTHMDNMSVNMRFHDYCKSCEYMKFKCNHEVTYGNGRPIFNLVTLTCEDYDRCQQLVENHFGKREGK